MRLCETGSNYEREVSIVIPRTHWNSVYTLMQIPEASIKIDVSHSYEPNSFLARTEFAIKLNIAVLYFDCRAVHCACQ
jgi:hypothetical protein